MNEGVIFEALKKLDCIKVTCVGDLSVTCACYQVLRALRDAERERCAKFADEMVTDAKAAQERPKASPGFVTINAAIEVSATVMAIQIRSGP